MKRFLYILPTNFEHVGINIKVQGQLQFLAQHYKTSLIYIRFKRQSLFLSKLLATYIFELKAIGASLCHDIIYVRYNPKSLFVNIWLILLSYIKPVYIEHNTIMQTELHFLNRFFESNIHQFILRCLQVSHCHHIAVNEQLKHHLVEKKLSSVIYAQNGFLKSPTDMSIIEPPIINQLKTFKQAFSHIAIFCGNGYPWHGCNDIIKLIQEHPTIGLIVVGPYSNFNTNQCLQFKFLSANTLNYVIEQCDFAFSTFRWDMLDITDGSPLKSRHYLCHGCPIIVNYHDCATDFRSLKPYIIDYRQLKDQSIPTMLTLNYNKQQLSELACNALSWKQYFTRFLPELSVK